MTSLNLAVSQNVKTYIGHCINLQKTHRFKPMIRHFTFFISCLVFSLSSLKAQQTINATLDVSGVARQYIVYVPASYDSTAATPLMFNFHGFTQQAGNHMLTSAMRPVADTAGFILVYPQGSNFFGVPHWNVGAWTNGSTADDLGFTNAMIDTLAATYNIDLNRVYSCGYSNGGYFSYELACQLGDRIAAIGSVGGKMSTETFNACNPTHRTPLVTIHGTADATVSYTSSAPANSKTLAQTHAYWVDYNGLNTDATISTVADIAPNDGSTVEYFQFRNAENCVAVDHYKVNGGGHDWVGVRGNMDIDASSVIWNFVKQYDLNGLIECGLPVSTNELTSENDLVIYPNPTRDLITIEVELQTPMDCRIYSMTGQLVMTKKIDPSTTLVDVSALTAGVYFLVVGDRRVRLVKG